MLNTILHPAELTETAPPLLISHGLYGSGRNWGVIAKRLADHRRVIAIDHRNHGDSPWKDSHGYPDLAGDLAGVIEAQGAGPMDVLGHSMGGKAAMVLALQRPDLVRRLIVADIAPVAYAHDQARHAAAMRALDLSGLASRREAEARMAETMDDPALRAFFLQSLDLKAPGGPRWRLNLDLLEAEMAQIVGWPGTPGQFAGPVLFLSGAESHYMRPEYRPAILSQFPRARFARIPGAGHWLHAEKPREFEAAVRVFLEA